MDIETISASSIVVWEECQAKFAANKTVPEFRQNRSAEVGSVCHYALEHIVRKVYIEKSISWEEAEKLVEQLVFEGYKEIFGSANKSDEDYKDALDLTKKWYKRTDLSGWIIDSVETKKRIDIGNTGVKLTYILDRCSRRIDSDGRKILKITDYKSKMVAKNADELRDDIQVRFYALAVAIEYKDWEPDEIWVELDYLRHNGPVGVEIYREQNIATWEYINQTVEIIKATVEPTYTLGAGCRFCPIKASCELLQKHIDAGNVLDLDIDELAELRLKISGQADGLAGLLGQIDSVLLTAVNQSSKKSLETAANVVKITQGGRRGIDDIQTAAEIIGPDVMKLFGKLNIGDVDKIIDSDMIDESQKAKLRALIQRKSNRPSIKVVKKPPIKEKD